MSFALGGHLQQKGFAIGFSAVTFGCMRPPDLEKAQAHSLAWSARFFRSWLPPVILLELLTLEKGQQ